jgi:hypothetical protein
MGAVEMLGRWPDAALVMMNPVDRGAAGEESDVFRWRGDRWDEPPVQSDVVEVLPWGAGGTLVVHKVGLDFEFDVFDPARWWAVSGVPAFSIAASCAPVGWRYPAGPGRFLALGSGDVFLLLACGIVAHSSPRARKWSFDHVPAALWPGPTRSEVDVRSVPAGELVAAAGDGAVLWQDGAAAYFDGTAWTDPAHAPTLGLARLPRTHVTTPAGDEWAFVPPDIFARRGNGSWLPVALPPGDDATELVLGGAGDVWVQLKSGRLLRDREVHAPVVCELGARPGSRLREVAP